MTALYSRTLTIQSPYTIQCTGTEPAFVMEGPALISILGDPILEAMLFEVRLL
jgi:hypothetical protein